MRLSVGLVAVCLGTSFSACHRPVAYFQRTPRDVYYTKQTEPTADNVPDGNVPEPVDSPEQPAPVAYVDSRVETTRETPAQRTQQHLQRTQRLLNESRPVGRNVPGDQPVPAAADRPLGGVAQVIPASPQFGPGPKQRKTLREILGLPPKKELNWWQRIPWQLKAATVVTLVAVVFAILNITVLAIVFGIIGAFLLIRGLKKSFKVRRGIFGLGGR